jgi:hypothetical protein
MKSETDEGLLELADQRVARPALLQRKARLVRTLGTGIRPRCDWCGLPSAGSDADGTVLCSVDLMVARQRRTRAAMRSRG